MALARKLSTALGIEVLAHVNGALNFTLSILLTTGWIRSGGSASASIDA
jgi:hypothetical protein